MPERVKVPAIRFIGYNDTWKKYKLGDVTKSYSGGTPSVGVREFYNGKIPFIRSAEINSSKTELFISEAGLMNSSAKMVDAGDILYALYGATSGEVGIAQIKGAINQAILAIKPADYLDSSFLLYWLRYKKHNITEKFLQGGQGNLSGSLVKELIVQCPNYKEQQKIGAFFHNLDRLISLQQRKLAKLKNVKEALLEKMFPQEGESVPQIRFAGFSGEWSEQNIGNILLERNEQAPKSIDYPLMAFVAFEGVTPKGARYDRSSLISDEKNKLYKRTVYGDFIYSSNNLETGSIGLNKFGNATISPVYSIFFPINETDSYFIGQRLTRKDFINELVRWRQGVIYGQWRIHESDFVKVKILLPSSNEQKKIGSFFYNLDQLINIQQKKIDKLQNFKKACLEKMFI